MAGADLLLQPTDPKLVIDAIEAAVRSGRVSEARLNESVRRILAIKERLGLFHRRTVALDSVEGVGSTFRVTLPSRSLVPDRSPSADERGDNESSVSN